MDGSSSFPSRPEMELNLATFAERTGMRVRYDCAGRQLAARRTSFVLTHERRRVPLPGGRLRRRRGRAVEARHARFRARAHYVDTREAASYAGKRLFIVGKQNSGFELATGLLPWAQRIVLASPRPAKLSVNTHSLLGVRARYVQPFEDEVLGGGVFILNASIDRVERFGGGFASTASAPRVAAS
jgi:hypothetical protein